MPFRADLATLLPAPHTGAASALSLLPGAAPTFCERPWCTARAVTRDGLCAVHEEQRLIEAVDAEREEQR